MNGRRKTRKGSHSVAEDMGREEEIGKRREEDGKRSDGRRSDARL